MAIAGFMSAVVDDPDWDNRLTDYEVLVDRLRDGRLNREAGMPIGQMQTIANSITQHYRSAGDRLTASICRSAYQRTRSFTLSSTNDPF